MSDAAIVSIVTGVVTVVVLWLKLRYGVEAKADQLTKQVEEKTNAIATTAAAVETKIDTNTQITRAGASAAVVTAKSAADAAVATKVVADQINSKINGGIDGAVATAIAPIRKDVDELSVYVHQRNHDLLNSLQTLTNKMDLILELARQQQQQKRS